jgi:hypothetical protein
MALHKGLLKSEGFPLPKCEKHFHDHDEIWLIQKGKGKGYWIDYYGQRVEFILEPGDVWLIPVGYEHGLSEDASPDFRIWAIIGTQPPNAQGEWGHYYMEKSGYIPSFELRKTQTGRYDSLIARDSKDASK